MFQAVLRLSDSVWPWTTYITHGAGHPGLAWRLVLVAPPGSSPDWFCSNTVQWSVCLLCRDHTRQAGQETVDT